MPPAFPSRVADFPRSNNRRLRSPIVKFSTKNRSRRKVGARQRLSLFSLGPMTGDKEIEVRPFSSCEEYELMLDYFYKADDSFLRGMGVDRLKLPERDKWLDSLLADHEKPDGERDRFYLIWIFQGRRVGHSSINNIVLGTEAFIHLHLWDSQLRRAGLGTEFVRRSANFYFERFNLRRLVCEPRAENAAPNRVLEKLGFAFVRRYRTTPGVISYEQEVNRYELRRKG